MPDDWVRTPAQQAAIDLQAKIDARAPSDVVVRTYPGSAEQAYADFPDRRRPDDPRGLAADRSAVHPWCPKHGGRGPLWAPGLCLQTAWVPHGYLPVPATAGPAGGDRSTALSLPRRRSCSGGRGGDDCSWTAPRRGCPRRRPPKWRGPVTCRSVNPLTVELDRRPVQVRRDPARRQPVGPPAIAELLKGTPWPARQVHRRALRLG